MGALWAVAIRTCLAGAVLGVAMSCARSARANGPRSCEAATRSPCAGQRLLPVGIGSQRAAVKGQCTHSAFSSPHGLNSTRALIQLALQLFSSLHATMACNGQTDPLERVSVSHGAHRPHSPFAPQCTLFAALSTRVRWQAEGYMHVAFRLECSLSQVRAA
jgi:hypothetical protein